jgi:hypothetical protein
MSSAIVGVTLAPLRRKPAEASVSRESSKKSNYAHLAVKVEMMTKMTWLNLTMVVLDS